MKKKIYTFTLEDDEYPSKIIKNNLKVIAALMYEELEVRDFENPNAILIHSKNLIKNELYEVRIGNEYEYSFGSEKSQIDHKMYEPLIIDETSFGITVIDEKINDYDMYKVLSSVLKLACLDYKFKMSSVSYDSKNIDDESNRISTIKKIKMPVENSSVKVKRLVPALSMLRMMRG